MTIIVQQRGDIRAPRTRAELDALVARRGELQSQLRSSEERRFQLSQQASHTAQEARGALNQRIATLDARIAQIEAQLLQLDDAIAAGLANADLIHSSDEAIATAAPPPVPPPPSPDAIVVIPGGGPAIPINARTVLAGGLLTLSLLFLVGWLAWRRALATLSRKLQVSGVGQPDMSQLQQSVDAIALEVERISENQRFVTKLLNQQAPGAPLSAAEPERLSVEHTKRRDR